MSEDLSTFLTISQAVEAIALDLGQYGPQPDLLRRITPLILGKNANIAGNGKAPILQIRRNSSQPFTTMDERPLIFYLIHMLEAHEQEPGAMAEICALVFQTEARPGKRDGRVGVWIQNQMTGFACLRCGNCCRNLGNYCSKEDLELWKGREDILSWVKKEETATGQTRYLIWVHPETGALASSCPFLRNASENKGFFCGIQEIKPRVCQEYPYTKKHGVMTGCPGCGHPGSGI